MSFFPGDPQLVMSAEAYVNSPSHEIFSNERRVHMKPTMVKLRLVSYLEAAGTRIGDEERRLMHLVPALVIRKGKGKVLRVFSSGRTLPRNQG